jgi:hypothetical protein
VIRHRGRAVIALLALTLFAALAATADAQAQTYTFTKIADSAEGLTPDRCPAINNAGQVAFTAFTAEGVQTIFRAEPNGELTAIADETSRFSFFGANPSINEQGQVSFAAALEKDGEAIVISKGKTLKIAARTEPGRFNFFGFNTSLNNLGEVVFTAELDEAFGFDEGTFVTDGSKTQTVYLASTSQFLGTDSRRSINDAGQIAFAEDLDDFTSGIFRFDPGSGFVTIVDENSSVVDFATDPQLNNGGVVVFHAFLDAGGEAIMTGSGGVLTTVADTSGPFGSFAFFGGPSINDLGEVAFGASLDGAFETGIYTGADPVVDRVIAPGDTLDGAVVTNTVLCSEGLNDAGQIVFVADLQQGDEFRTAIFVATPGD